MKKVILTSLIAASSCVMASDANYYFTPTIGKVVHESSDLNKEKVFGFRVGMPFENNFGFDTAEFAYDRQSSVDYTSLPQNTNINRFSANALKHYSYTDAYTPYGLAGVGFETFSNEKLDADDALFLNVGVGIKYKLQNDMSLMTDIRHIVRLAEFDSHTIFNIGLVIPFGQKQKAEILQKPVVLEEKKAVIVEEKKPIIIEEKKPEPVIVPVVVAPKDSDNDGVIDELDKCPTSPAGAKVDANGCCLDSDKDGVKDFADKCPTTPAGFKVDANGCCIDSDKDGVKDPKDKCPNTPAGFKVDADGCEIGYNLKINFDTNKADIKDEYNDEISKFVLFMNAFPVYKAEIGGHTDNLGDANSNKKLSQQRADSVKNRFIKDGVASDRMSSVGFGEEKPVASNDTVEGRNENRRIEVILSK